MTKTSPFKPLYMPFLSARAKKISKNFEQHIKKNSRVLDIGCGNMLVASHLKKKKNVDIYGIDVLDMNLTDLPHQIFDGSHIPYADKTFDNSLLIAVLHHVRNQHRLLTEVKRVTKNNLIIFEDIYQSVIEKRWVQLRDILGNIPEELHMNFALNFHTQLEWKYIFAAHSLKVIKCEESWNPWRLTRHALYILKT